MKKLETFEQHATKFVVNNRKFQLFLSGTLIAESHFSIEEPDELFDQKYVGLFILFHLKLDLLVCK